MATRRKKTKKQIDETLVDITEVKEKAEGFLEQNRNLIIGAVSALVLIVGGFFFYNNFYMIPRNQEAQEKMFQAEMMFQKDSFNLALNSPGDEGMGFLQIIDKYGSTKAGNLAEYYAGVCYLNTGDLDNAIKHLKAYSPKGHLKPIVTNGALGDAYAQKEDYNNAISYYNRAIKAGDDNFLTPHYLKKVAILNEQQGDLKAALKAYETIKEKYPKSSDGQTIDRYIARVEAKM